MSRSARCWWLVAVLAATGCIKVPTGVKASFCAQPARKNHFGSGAAAGSCCVGEPHVTRFGSYSGACSR